MLGVHEATGSKPVFLTNLEKPSLLLSLSSRPPSVITHTTKYKIAADARKRGDPSTGSSAISRRPILARILPGKAWSVNVFLAQTERAGQACEAPDASSILAEDTFSSDGSTDRAAGYGPANEGSSPSPNTISSRRSRVTLYAIHTLSVTPCSLPRLTTRHFIQEVAQPGRARARGARGHGIEARFPDHFERVA